MKPVTSLWRFAASVFVYFIFSMAVWSQISAWTSYPAAALARIVIDSQAYNWVESTANVPGKLSATVRFRKRLPDQRLSTPIAQVEPAHYTYGVNLFIALLLGSHGRKLGRKLVLGSLVLCIPQAFSLVLVLLTQILREVPIRMLNISYFTTDLITISNIFGMLVLPTLAPVGLWLWLEWEVVVRLWCSSRAAGHAAAGAEDAASPRAGR